jgi:hypothetical protein
MMSFDESEKAVVEHFITRYNEYHCSSYCVQNWPDEIDRNRKAIDAVAKDGTATLGIEHTLLQPFLGEKQDSSIFKETFGPLDQRADLILPNYHVDLILLPHAIAKGFDWSRVGPAVEAWYLSEQHALPLGKSNHQVPISPVVLFIAVDKAYLPGPGSFLVQRFMPADSLEAVISTALARKIPKLISTLVDSRVLLLEQDSPVRCWTDVGESLRRLERECPDLDKVDEIWVIRTYALGVEGWTTSHLVWPSVQAAEFTRRRTLLLSHSREPR